MIIDFLRLSPIQTRTWNYLLDIIEKDCNYTFNSDEFNEFVKTRYQMVFQFESIISPNSATSVEISEPAYLMLKLKYYNRVDFDAD